MYILNRCPDIGDFNVFGSMCFSRVLEQLRRKLDDRIQATSAYKLYSPNEVTIVICRDVQVDKSESWNSTQRSIQHDQDTVRIVFEYDQTSEEINAQNEETSE